MKPFFTAFAFCATASLLLLQHTHAQTKTNSTLQAPPAHIKIDGDLKEWGDSLQFYNTEKKTELCLS